MICEKLPVEIISFLTAIEDLGFSLCMVGGVPRDFIFSKKIGNDLDFEIRPAQKSNVSLSQWPEYYKKLHHFLNEKKLAYTELPYLITRVYLCGVHFEFSSPRVETDIPDNFSHHHFEAQLDPDLNYEQSFIRRDFTINAIGLELHLKEKREVVIDPFHGIDDLKKGCLRKITDHFFLDSVRFLRLIRFSIKFENFTIDNEILNNLSKFNLTKLSIHHFKEELFKSRPGAFLNKFAKLVSTYQLAVPAEFSVWTHYTMPENLGTKEEILAFVFLQNPADAKSVAVFFSMPEKKLKDLKSFYQSLETVSRLTSKELLDFKAMPIDLALTQTWLKDLKNLEEKKEWQPILSRIGHSQKLLVSWNDWSGTIVESAELDLIPTAYRSYYLYYKTIKTMNFAND